MRLSDIATIYKNIGEVMSVYPLHNIPGSENSRYSQFSDVFIAGVEVGLLSAGYLITSIDIASDYIHEQINAHRRDFGGVEWTCAVCAGFVSTITHLAGSVALGLLADKGGCILARSVTWITSNQGIIVGLRVITPLGILIGSAYILYKTNFFEASLRLSAAVIYKTVRWIVDDAFTKDFWQFLFLEARSCVSYIDADELNSLNDRQLKYMHAGVIKYMADSEKCKLDERILDCLPEPDKEEIDNLRHPRDMEMVHDLNSEPTDGKTFSIDRINALSRHAIRYLSSGALARLKEQAGGIIGLSAQVLNNLSAITLAELGPNIFQELSPETLPELKARVFNGSSFPLDQWLSDDIKRRLSIVPIILTQIPLHRQPIINDVAARNIRDQILEGRRAYWIPRYEYEQLIPSIEGIAR